MDMVKTSDSSVNRELIAIRDKELENEPLSEDILKGDVRDLFDNKVYNSLKHALLKITKAS
jgi:hypothetical protein